MADYTGRGRKNISSLRELIDDYLRGHVEKRKGVLSDSLRAPRE